MLSYTGGIPSSFFHYSDPSLYPIDVLIGCAAFYAYVDFSLDLSEFSISVQCFDRHASVVVELNNLVDAVDDVFSSSPVGDFIILADFTDAVKRLESLEKYVSR